MGAVTYTKKAIKGLRKILRHHADNLRSASERIAAGDSQGLNITTLQGRQGYRLRSGDYRAIYEIDGEQINVIRNHWLDVSPDNRALIVRTKVSVMFDLIRHTHRRLISCERLIAA